MAVYFASDMHLRLDHPARAERLASWVETLEPTDRLYVVGDLCDFWFATRQLEQGAERCAGLASLANYRRRGGPLTVLLGNHDLWLGRFYEQFLGAEVVAEPLRLEVHGLRLHIVHGHRAGGRQPWKAGMESRAFFRSFQALPSVVANALDHKLDSSNEKGRIADENRLIGVFREYADKLAGSADLAIFGHVHRPHDDAAGNPRLVVLGGWHHQSSHLRVDDRGAELVVVPAQPATHISSV